MKITSENFEESLLKSAEQAVEHTAIDAVMEYAATLRKRLTEVEMALSYYADPINYSDGVLDEQNPGDLARRILNK